MLLQATTVGGQLYLQCYVLLFYTCEVLCEKGQDSLFHRLFNRHYL